jgi:hypothetical protein
VGSEGRRLKLIVDPVALQEASRLDGCYVLQTDLPESAASPEEVHARYKDLAQVEQAFRTCKTTPLETRPLYVRTAEYTRGHVLVVMLAYLIRRELSRAWASLDLPVEEGLHQLQTLCSTEVQVEGGSSCLRIPTPDGTSRSLLNALKLHLPEALPRSDIRVSRGKSCLGAAKPR